MAQDTPNVRSAGRKLDLSELRAQPDTNQVVVKFREGEKVRVANQKLTGMRSGQANLLNNVLRQAGVTETALTPLFEAPPEELERDRSEGQRRSGRELADLSLYFVITLPPTASAAEVANNLNTLPFVEYARPALRPAPPPIYSIPKAPPTRCPRVTRRAQPRRTSRRGKPTRARRSGIGPIPNVKGSDGRGMSFADIEYRWTMTHEDLCISSLRARYRDRADARSLRRPRAWHGRARHSLEPAEQFRRHRHRAAAPWPMLPRQARRNWATSRRGLSASP